MYKKILTILIFVLIIIITIELGIIFQLPIPFFTKTTPSTENLDSKKVSEIIPSSPTPSPTSSPTPTPSPFLYYRLDENYFNILRARNAEGIVKKALLEIEYEGTLGKTTNKGSTEEILTYDFSFELISPTSSPEPAIFYFLNEPKLKVYTIKDSTERSISFTDLKEGDTIKIRITINPLIEDRQKGTTDITITRFE